MSETNEGRALSCCILVIMSTSIVPSFVVYLFFTLIQRILLQEVLSLGLFAQLVRVASWCSWSRKCADKRIDPTPRPRRARLAD